MSQQRLPSHLCSLWSGEINSGRCILCDSAELLLDVVSSTPPEQYLARQQQAEDSRVAFIHHILGLIRTEQRRRGLPVYGGAELSGIWSDEPGVDTTPSSNSITHVPAEG